jgi:hypothetical protein
VKLFKKYGKIIGTVLTLLLLTIIILIPPVSSLSANISIIPRETNVTLRNNFTITVSIEPNDNEVYGAQFALLFDTNKLEAAELKRGTFLSQDGNPTQIYKQTYHNTKGLVQYAETRTGKRGGISTPGTLATISFIVKEVGAGERSKLDLENVILFTPLNFSTIPTVISEGYIVTEPIPTPPPSPTPTSTPTPTLTQSSNGGGDGSADTTPIPTSAPTLIPTPTPASTTALPPQTTAIKNETGEKSSRPISQDKTNQPPKKASKPPHIPGFDSIGCIAALIIIILLKKSFHSENKRR